MAFLSLQSFLGNKGNTSVSSTSKSTVNNIDNTSKDVAKTWFDELSAADSKKDISTTSVSNLASIGNQTNTTKKTASVGNILFSYLVKPPFDFATKYTLKAVSGGLLLFGSPSHTQNHKIEKIVNDLTGSPHILKAMHAVTPTLASIIQEKIVALGLWDGISGFLMGANSSLQSIIKVMLPKVYVNMAKHFNEHIADEKGNCTSSFTLVDALAGLTDVIHSHFANIHAKFEIIDKISDPSKREKKMRQLFAPLSAELLSIMLPDGEKELPIVRVPFVTKYFFSRIKNEILPDTLFELYVQLAAPFSSKNKQILQSMGADSLVSVAEGAAQKAGEVIPAFCLDISSKSQESATSAPFMESIAASASRVFAGSDVFKTYLSKWLVGQLEAFFKCQNPDIKLFWKFLGSYLEPVMLHVFRHMADIPSSDKHLDMLYPDVSGIIAIKFCTLTNEFYNANVDVIEARLQACKQQGMEYDSDAELISLFASFSDNILLMMGLDDPSRIPIPEFLKNVVFVELKSLLPSLLLKQYLALKECPLNDQECSKKLHTLFFDTKNLRDPSIATSVLSTIHHQRPTNTENLSEIFYQELWEKSGTETIVKTIEGMVSVYSSDFVEIMFDQLGLSKQTRLNEEHNPFMKHLRVFLKSMTEIALLNMLAHVVETTPENTHLRHKDHPRLFLLMQALVRLCDIFEKGTKNLPEKLQEIDMEFADPSRRAQEIRKAFLPLASELQIFSSQKVLDHLPLHGMPGSEGIKEMLWEVIKYTILPDFLYTIYSEFISWHSQRHHSYQVLEDCYHTTHPVWASRVVAQYITDYIKHHCVTYHDDAAKSIVQSLIANFAQSNDSHGQYVRKILTEKSEIVESMLSQNIYAAGASKEPPITLMWPIFTKYVEAVIVKLLAKVSLVIRDIEADHPDFMVDAAINILKITSEYFNTLYTLSQKYNEDHIYTINPNYLIVGFGSKLHDGVPLDPSAPDAEKDQIRLDGWLLPLVYKFLKLADLSANDLPLPSFVRKPVGELLTDTIFSGALLHSEQTLLEPYIRDTIVLFSVESIYAALNAIEPTPKDAMQDVEGSAIDPQRKRLNESCGTLVLEMVKLIPDTMVQYVFMKEKVKNLSAEAIGDAIMAYLSKWTLLQVLDTLMYNILPNLHPSKWEGKAGRESLVPRKAILQPDGKMALQPVKKFKFTFPETPLELQEELDKKAAKTEEVRQQLRDGFTRTISSQVFAKAWTFMKLLWNSLQAQFDEWIALHFPDKGPHIKESLDKIFHKIFFDLLGPVVVFLSYPLIQLIKYIAEKIQIDRKSNDIIENIHLDTVEHLICKWIDVVVDTLVKLSKEEAMPQEKGSGL